jgi:hypothetical protein
MSTTEKSKLVTRTVDGGVEQWLCNLMQILFREGAYIGSAVDADLRHSVMSHFSE